MGDSYIGEYKRPIDSKGRLLLPSQLLKVLRDSDNTNAQVVIVRGEEKCIYLYDIGTWQKIVERARSKLSYDETRLLMHYAVSDVYISEIDGQNRILIPTSLRQYAAITNRAIVVGVFDRIEIWNSEEWLAYLDALEDVPQPSISQFSRNSHVLAPRDVTRRQQTA